jgi:two-component system chemotaxis sensor kinase CheA
MDLARYTELFLTESREHLAVMNRHLLVLERSPGARESLDATFRAVHTIKGMSGTMGYEAVTALAHEMETMLDALRGGRLRVTASRIAVCLDVADALEEMVGGAVRGDDLARVGAPLVARLRAMARDGEDTDGHATDTAGVAAAGASVASAAAAPAPRARQVRVDIARLDALTDLVGELIIVRGRLMQEAALSNNPPLLEAAEHTARLLDDLQHAVLQARMVPVSHVFDRFPRMVRDAARGLGKDVAFDMDGDDIEIDRSLLDELGDPIVHLLRNALDHGLEPAAERVAAGKPAEGRLMLGATRERSAVVVRVSDDGRGMDRAAIARRARELGMPHRGRGALSDTELLEIIARPGFSTATQVTEVSGRGVGIDAVLHRVRALGGTVEISSREGQGTTVTLRLPVTLAIVRALITRVRDEVYAIPLTHVSEALETDRSELRRTRGGEVMLHQGRRMPVLRLRELVHLPREPRDTEQVVMLEIGERRAGLIVDELTSQQDMVVKRFDAARDGGALFSGATILSDGAPALIVDVGGLMRGQHHG